MQRERHAVASAFSILGQNVPAQYTEARSCLGLITRFCLTRPISERSVNNPHYHTTGQRAQKTASLRQALIRLCGSHQYGHPSEIVILEKPAISNCSSVCNHITLKVVALTCFSPVSEGARFIDKRLLTCLLRSLRPSPRALPHRSHSITTNSSVIRGSRTLSHRYHILVLLGDS